MSEQIDFRFHVQGPESEQTVVALEGATTIGRQAGNEWTLPHPMVSRQHARLDCEGEQCTITDLDSSNGTLVNDEPLTPGVPHRLQADDVVVIGPFRLRYDPQRAPQPVAEEEEEEPYPAWDPADEWDEAPPEEGGPAEAAEAVPGREPAGAQAAGAEPPPPGPPPGGEPPAAANGQAGDGELPPGLYLDHSRYLQYLPDIYHTDFMARFLAVFEATLGPIEWTIDNFDLFLSPDTAPDGFLPWLASWFDLTLDPSWSIEQRRLLLSEASELFASRGTRRSLARVLEIYLQQPVVVDDEADALDPFTFAVYLPLPRAEVRRDLVERLIDAHKPAHTTYELHFADATDE